MPLRVSPLRCLICRHRRGFRRRSCEAARRFLEFEAYGAAWVVDYCADVSASFLTFEGLRPDWSPLVDSPAVG